MRMEKETYPAHKLASLPIEEAYTTGSFHTKECAAKQAFSGEANVDLRFVLELAQYLDVGR
jgi:hypothetical protein